MAATRNAFLIRHLFTEDFDEDEKDQGGKSWDRSNESKGMQHQDLNSDEADRGNGKQLGGLYGQLMSDGSKGRSDARKNSQQQDELEEAVENSTRTVVMDDGDYDDMANNFGIGTGTSDANGRKESKKALALMPLPIRPINSISMSTTLTTTQRGFTEHNDDGEQGRMDGWLMGCRIRHGHGKYPFYHSFGGGVSETKLIDTCST